MLAIPLIIITIAAVAVRLRAAVVVIRVVEDITAEVEDQVVEDQAVADREVTTVSIAMKVIWAMELVVPTTLSSRLISCSPQVLRHIR